MSWPPKGPSWPVTITAECFTMYSSRHHLPKWLLDGAACRQRHATDKVEWKNLYVDTTLYTRFPAVEYVPNISYIHISALFLRRLFFFPSLTAELRSLQGAGGVWEQVVEQTRTATLLLHCFVETLRKSFLPPAISFFVSIFTLVLGNFFFLFL